MNTSTTAQCGSEIVGEVYEVDIAFQLRATIGELINETMADGAVSTFMLIDAADTIDHLRLEITRLRNENSDLANKALSLQSELAAARKALEAAGSLICGYESGCSIDGIKTLENAYAAARAALSSKEPEGK